MKTENFFFKRNEDSNYEFRTEDNVWIEVLKERYNEVILASELTPALTDIETETQKTYLELLNSGYGINIEDKVFSVYEREESI